MTEKLKISRVVKWGKFGIMERNNGWLGKVKIILRSFCGEKNNRAKRNLEKIWLW